MGGRTIFIDRSRVETRQACPRQRFWAYDYQPPEALTDNFADAVGGISRESSSLPLLNGIAIHAAHARLLAGMPITEVISCIRAEYSAEVASKGVHGEVDTDSLIKEQITMLEGMVRLWAKWRLPAILAEYELATFDSQPAIELAWEWHLAPGLAQRIRMDAILRRRADGLLHILDYKSAKFVDESWSAKFEHSLQTELYVQALKERTGEPVGGILYEGLIKGAWRKDTAQSSPFCGQRIQASPYCYAYVLGDTDYPDDCVWYTTYTAKKGFVKVRISDIMPIEQWVEKLATLVSPSEMFVVVPPICPPPFELERVKRQIVNQELAYHSQLAEYRRLLQGGYTAQAEDLLDIFAPQVGGQCVRYGADYKCSYMDICWSQGATPLEDGGFVVRTPHHDESEKEAA